MELMSIFTIGHKLKIKNEIKIKILTARNLPTNPAITRVKKVTRRDDLTMQLFGTMCQVLISVTVQTSGSKIRHKIFKSQ